MCGFAFEGLNKNWRMETETTDNELIAKFMGLERKYESTNQVFIDNLKYHTSWDWLMPVVEKIEAHGAIVEIWLSLGRGCRIYFVKERNEFIYESNSTIESVYKSVVEFIKWYNKINQKP